MRGPQHWITLPREAVQNRSHNYAVKDPVVELLLALYGHPDSPTHWELHCAEVAVAVGFKAFGAEWPSVFYHDELKLVLSIYVDDFKLAGPADALEKGWALLRTKIELEDPGPVGLYLGCQQQRVARVGPPRCTAWSHDLRHGSVP